jgi:biotin carboxylase
MSETLLVLAASLYQIPAIETAKRMGYRVITADNCPGNPGHTLADAAFGIDTTDTERILALARRESVCGVIAPATDVAVVTAAHVSEHLRLPGPPVAAACVLTQKYGFREFLGQYGFCCPSAFPIDDDQVPGEQLFDGRTWIIKPNRSSGAKGVFIVSTHEEFLAHVLESRTFSLDRTAVLEEFVDGTQHTCEGVLEGGRVALALITDRDAAPSPYTATMAHRVPSRLAETARAEAVRIVENAFRRLGVADGPFDCDFVAAREGIVLLEMTPRIGGNSLSTLFKAALEFDLTAYAVSYACGDPHPVPERVRPIPMSIEILGVDRSGRLAWNESEARALRRESWVKSLILDLPQGTPVMPFVNGRHRVGEALIAGSDRAELDRYLAEFRARLALEAA